MGPVGKAGALAAGVGLLVAGTGPLAGGASARPACDAGWRFEHPRRVVKKMVVFDRERNENRTGSRASTTFTANRGGTASYSVSGDFGGGLEEDFFGVIKLSVESHLGVTVVHQMHADLGNSITVKMRPHHWVKGKYGVFRLVVRGHLFYLTRTCQRQHNRPRLKAKLPLQVGWRVSSGRIHRH
jgi:hypothetical protein